MNIQAKADRCADQPDKHFTMETIPTKRVHWEDPQLEVLISGFWVRARRVVYIPDETFITTRRKQRQDEYVRRSEKIDQKVPSTYPPVGGFGSDNVATLISTRRLPRKPRVEGHPTGPKRVRLFLVERGVWEDE